MTDTRVEPILQVHGLRLSYRDRGGTERVLVDDLSFDANPGEIICIAGRSGSGKSTLLRSLIGLQRPHSGTISWSGQQTDTLSVDELAELRRTRASFVDQSATLVEELTVLENVTVPAVPGGRAAVREARGRAMRQLSVLGIRDLHRRRPHELSGGERQRACLTRGLIMGASALVADEPTASLDRDWADLVISQLREHATVGKVIIVASHDPAVVDEADRVISLH